MDYERAGLEPPTLESLNKPLYLLSCSLYWTFLHDMDLDWRWKEARYQTVQLGHGTLAARLTDVPDFHAAFAAGVDVTGGVADGHRTHHLAVVQRVDLAGVARDARSDQGVGRKGHRLHLTVGADVEGVGAGGEEKREAVM